MLLIAVAVGGIAATTASETAHYRQAREREEELHFRARAYVEAIRSFYMAEPDPRRRRLPVSVEELQRDPRFPLKRHIRRPYEDPLAAKPGTPFRALTGSPSSGQPQGLIGVASTAGTPVFKRAGFTTKGGPTLGIETAKDLTFEVDLRELIAASRPPGAAPQSQFHPPPPIPAPQSHRVEK